MLIIKEFFTQLFTLIKEIIGDIIFVYKNIFHWMFSKILISASAYFMGFVFSLPFFIGSLIVFYFSAYDFQTIGMATFQALHPSSPQFMSFTASLFFILFLSFIGGIIILVGIMYSKLLLARLNFGYIKRKKLAFKKNKYFSRVLFTQYFGLTGNIMLYLLIPIIAFLVVFVMLYFSFGLHSGGGGVDFIESPAFKNFAIVTGIVLFLFSLLFVYITYRIGFSFFILAKSKSPTVRGAIKKSVKNTRGVKNIVHFICVLLFFLVLLTPVYKLGQYLDFKANATYNFWSLKEKVKSGNPQEILSQEEFYTYSILKLEYGNASVQEILGKYRFLNILQWVYFVLNFLVFYGILDLVIASFYKRQFLKK